MRRVVWIGVLLLGIGGHAAQAELGLTRVMLSVGGVGYFEYATDIDGDETLGLDVPVAQVDDILKSLVVFDPAGAVARVELPGRDNTIEAFGNAPFGPKALETPAGYLNALRGVEVTVRGPKPLTGRVMRAEAVTETTGRTVTQRTRVTLLGAEGMQQFVLEDIDAVQVTDPALRDRIGQTLQSLRNEAKSATRRLTIRITGQGKRTVAVGYVAAAPLWKATYRLMLSTASVARLQGWATLENQSGSDWKGVALTLQYGNPVTFRQALYRSYFVQRPEVPIEILGQVLPDIDARARAMPDAVSAPAPAGKSLALAAAAQSPAAPADAALAVEAEEETIFSLSQPVDLAAGHSANMPIIDRNVPVERIGLVPFQQPHPLVAVRVHNTGPESLPAGVLTIYETASGAASYAGDARLGGLPSGESRLLPFSRDLRTGIETTQSSAPNATTRFSVADGVLTYTMRTRQVIRIVASAPAREARDLLLDIPKADTDQTLTVDDGKTPVAEQTATAFRIALSLRPAAVRTVTAWLDQPISQSVALVDGDDATIQLIADDDTLDPSARAALRAVLDLRRDAAGKSAAVERQRKRQEDVLADEDRIRKNLAAVTPADALHARLMRALDADETSLQQLRASIDDSSVAAEKAHRALADAVGGLRL